MSRLVSYVEIMAQRISLHDIYGVEQYGSNHDSLRESCKLYIFSHR